MHFIRIAALLAFAFAATLPARAVVPVGSTEHMTGALQGFISRLEEAKQANLLPQLSNSKDAPVLEALWDIPAIIGSAPYHATDLPILMDIIQQQAQIIQIYIVYTPDQSKKPDIAKNSIAFQDEISRASVAMLSFSAAALQAADEFASNLKQDGSDKARIEGLVKLRAGLQQVINTTALMLRNPDLKKANQEQLATALAAVAPAIVNEITLQDRKVLSAILEEIRPRLSQTAQQSISNFITTMSASSCAGLCALK